jgi:hypothetical protein
MAFQVPEADYLSPNYLSTTQLGGSRRNEQRHSNSSRASFSFGADLMRSLFWPLDQQVFQ